MTVVALTDQSFGSVVATTELVVVDAVPACWGTETAHESSAIPARFLNQRLLASSRHSTRVVARVPASRPSRTPPTWNSILWSKSTLIR